MFQTPVLLLVFNRPETTGSVFEIIRALKPHHLYIAADGPRSMVPGEKELCHQVKQIVAQVDWPCEVQQLYRAENLGCKLAVSGAINWFFDQVEEGIILEDDCLPAPSFFNFCEQMLSMYRDDLNVWHISGNNFQDGIRRSTNSHYISKYTHIWGWATWRRAWKNYDVHMANFPEWMKTEQNRFSFATLAEKKFWLKKFKACYDQPHKLTTWDYQWLFTAWSKNGMCINPEVNLVKNIGIGSGTHTLKSIDKFIIESHPLNIPDFKIITPKVDQEADRYTFENYLAYKGNLVERFSYRFRKLFK